MSGRPTWEDRVTNVMVAGIIFYVGWISSAAYFNISGRWENEHRLVHVETMVVPKLKTQVKQLDCDRTKLAKVATQAISSNQFESVPTPDWDEVNGCPKVKPVKPPPVSAILKTK